MSGKVAVFSAGSWGTAFSIVLADAGNEVTLWARREEVSAAINEQRENPEYLPGVQLPPTVSATHDVEKALHGADLVVLATPSQSLRANLTQWAPYIEPGATMVSLMKGVELGTLDRMSQVIGEVTGAGPERIAVDQRPQPGQGDRPPRAGRLGRGVRGRGRRQAAAGAHATRRPSGPTPASTCSGASSGGAYKNVVALAVGMAVGLGFGDNTTASVITRGLAETARLAMALGANPLTLMGLAGLGDLVATCSSPLSRNRTFGEKLGQGMTAEEIYTTTRQVAEGAKSCSSLLALAEQAGVDAPLAHHVDAVIDARMTAQQMMDAFIARDTKAETD